jgi:hypothetical protein
MAICAESSIDALSNTSKMATFFNRQISFKVTKFLLGEFEKTVKTPYKILDLTGG